MSAPHQPHPVVTPRVLVVEDMPSLALTYAGHLERAGFGVTKVASGAAALDALKPDRHGFAAILLDLQLPDIDGLAFLRANPWLVSTLPVVVVTADASLSRAIEAMRLGAFDFLVKPLAGHRLVRVVTSALETGRAVAEPAKPASGGRPDVAPDQVAVGRFVGSSSQMREVYRQIGCIARSRATVFITGESGTGKEVCAETIHRESGRRDGAFVALNCGAIPENLLESEIFGHIKGSFTGAVADRVGAAQAAHKGTLFLDEICEMPLSLQVKLLRFLQTGTIQRVGTARAEDVDVRIIAATNRDPEKEVREGRFREDLWYRLAVVPLHMPPLRDRGHDIAELAEAFLARFAREEAKQFAPLGPDAIARLMAWNWPGNVRELQNVLRRAAVMCDGPTIPLAMLPAQHPGQASAPPALVSPTFAAGDNSALASRANANPECTGKALIAQALRGLTLDEIERIAVDAAIVTAGGSLPGAARLLGISPSTLYRKRERWSVDADPRSCVA